MNGVEYAGVLDEAAAVLGTAMTGEHRRRILAAGRQAERAAVLATVDGEYLDAERRAAIGEAAARAELAAIVAEVGPMRGGAPAATPRAAGPTGTASLVLRISGTSYAVRRVDCPDHAAAVACFSVRKAGADEAYHVSQHTDGLRCTCGDWTFRREGHDPRGCKHTRSLVAVGLIAYTPAERAAAAEVAPEQPPFPRAVRPLVGRPPSATASVLTHGPGLDTIRGGHSA
jgi:hypothetical protein